MLFCGATALEDGWSRNEAYSRNEEYTRSMLDAFMIGDQEVVLDIMGAEAEKEFFNVYRHITKAIKGNVGYDLVLLQNHSYTEEGYLVHRSKYRITFSDETVYSVTVYGVEKMEGLAYFEINLIDNEVAENLAPNGLTVGMTALTLLSMAFAVFNLLPVPPLDGSKILFSVLSDRNYLKLMIIERYGMILMLILVSTGILRTPLSYVTGFCFDLLFPIAQVTADWTVALLWR
jgi:hypothetical protein